MAKIYYLYCLCIAFICGAVTSTMGQNVGGLEQVDVFIDNLVQPLQQLPAEVQTYQINSIITSKNQRINFAPNIANNHFFIKNLQRTANNGDLQLNVELGDFVAELGIGSVKPDSVTYYYCEETITTNVRVQVVNRQNKVLLDESCSEKSVHKSAPFTNYQAALTFMNGARAGFEMNLSKAYDEALKELTARVLDNFSYAKAHLRFYHNIANKAEYIKEIDQIKAALTLLANGKPMAEIKSMIEPSIVLFQANATNEANQKDNAGKKLILASQLNLLQLYSAIEDFESAARVADGLIERNVISAKQHIKRFATDRDRYEQRKNSLNNLPLKPLGKRPQARYDSLMNSGINSGYIILRDSSRRIYGDILDLLKNANDGILKMKYEKNLNSPVEDVRYSLLNVAEIHLDDWDIYVLQHNDKILFSELLFESPHIKIYRSFPAIRGFQLIPKDWLNISLLEKKTTQKMYGLRSTQNGVFNDCPLITKRLSYNFYSDVLAAAIDYDTLCAYNIKPEASKGEKRPLVASNNMKPSHGSVGFNTGLNSFNSLVGVDVSLRVVNRLHIRAGLGFGVWGMRYAAGIRWDNRKEIRFSPSWGFAAGIGYNAGNRSFDYETTIDEGSPNEQTINARITTQPVRTLHFSLITNIPTGTRGGLNAEVGYAYANRQNAYKISTPNAVNVADIEPVANFLQPGGFILSVGAYRLF
jgi:hypothetical protein